MNVKLKHLYECSIAVKIYILTFCQSEFSYIRRCRVSCGAPLYVNVFRMTMMRYIKERDHKSFRMSSGACMEVVWNEWREKVETEKKELSINS